MIFHCEILMSLIANVLYTRPRLEEALSVLDRGRLKLPIVNLSILFRGFDDAEVVLRELPAGPWSSPIADVVLLAKISLCLKPQLVLEVGSYRGYTTKILAEHTPAEARIVAFDCDPRHGSAYRNLPLARKIERRVGEVSEDAFERDRHGQYHLIFLDADHTYEAVKHDTDILLPLLAPEGIFVWHDYANWGRFSRKNGVPEVLHELAERLPVVAVGGSGLAMYSPAWSGGAGAARLAAAQQANDDKSRTYDVWSTNQLR
jgi:predicted O-methyltransferase YrrM